MRFKLTVLLLLAGSALPAGAAYDPAPGKPTEQITATQLEQRLTAAQAKPDAELSQLLSGLELSERLSAPRLARLNAALPGDKSHQALMLLADSAAFLDLPDAEVPTDPVPDAAALRKMMTLLVSYVNTTVRQLPNLMAVRETTRFEDRPQEDVLSPTGITTVFYQPLHYVGKGNVQVTYRDHHEVVNEGGWKAVTQEAPMRGLVTAGEFGPFLSTVVADAIHGTITWAHWEQGASQTEAVFHYVVPKEKSHYSVQFSSDMNANSSAGEPPEWQMFHVHAAYHGQIVFNPATGAILRITIEADMEPGEMVTKSAMLVEYGPVEIGEKSYICPLKSVSILQNRRTRSAGQVSPGGSLKTFLNDVTFEHYRRFGSEVHILN
jgi:hypothetical protein